VMSTTPQLLKLVREGLATPQDVALLIELRHRVATNRRRIKFREHPVLFVAAFVGVFLLGIVGIRRED
jgi:hypothetical protein